MRTVHFYSNILWTIFYLLQVDAFDHVTLIHDGPVILGGTITFRADLYNENGERPSGTYKYKWQDNALTPHEYETSSTSNTTSYWSITYPRENNIVGVYEVQVIVSGQIVPFWWNIITSLRTKFDITAFLNGNITITQQNRTLQDTYVSSVSEVKMKVNIRKGDYDFLKEKATSISTYWFIDCKYYGQTNDLSFTYNFTSPNVAHTVEAVVVASYDPPTTTTVLPLTTTPLATTVAPNTTVLNSNVTTAEAVTLSIVDNKTSATTIMEATEMVTTPKIILSTTVKPISNNTAFSNISFPYVCSNSTIIPPDPNKTYGHFTTKINVRAPIMNITVEGTNWIQPWDMLSLNVTCKGSGPFYKCLQFHRGKYNVTGNETCDNGDHLHSCNFSIIHYFLEPSVYTILVILNNDVSKQVYPLTINIYKVTTKPQLSVIVVPVTCTLAAVVLIVFGIAYYIQSRARFTIEVADFDFGQSNPEMEYKTFTERLRDSFNNTINPGNKRISGYEPLSNPENVQ